MQQRLAYLVGADLRPQAGVERCDPVPEYAVFVQRNGAEQLDYSLLNVTKDPFARRFAQRGQPHVGLAFAALAQRSRYAGLVVSGEDVGLPLALLARLRAPRTPIYIITHGSYFASPKFARLLNLARGLKNLHFLCLSETLRQTMIGDFGVAARQVHDTGYGVDLEFFQPITLEGGESEPIVVASAGVANRDYRTLVRAVQDVPADVRIAADSAWFPSAVDIANDGLPPNVAARSYGNYTGLRGLYAKSAFVVVPLYPARHACGYAVIAEAMAMGRAVITTRTASHSNFVIDGETGYYVREGDADDMREKILRLVNDPELARRMGRAARERMEAEFSVETYCERMEQVIAATLPDKNP